MQLAYVDCYINTTNWLGLLNLTSTGNWGEWISSGWRFCPTLTQLKSLAVGGNRHSGSTAATEGWAR